MTTGQIASSDRVEQKVSHFWSPSIAPAQKPKRPLISDIQLLRFLAASTVMLGHAQAWIESRGLVPFKYYAIFLLDLRVGVDIFFVISGFVIFHTSSPHFADPGYSRRFIANRLIRILPLYWSATSAMLMAILIAPSIIQHKLLSWDQIACSFLFLPFNRPSQDYSFPLVGIGWTLNYEMFFYLCFSVVLLFRRPSGLFVLAAGFGIAVLFRFFFLRHTYIRFLSEWTDPIILEFIFGVGLGYIFQQGVRLSRSLGWLLALLGLSALIATNRTELSDFELYRPVMWGLPALIICAGLILSDGKYTSLSVRRIVLFGGSVSYALYLTHEFTFNAMWFVLRSNHEIAPPWLILTMLCFAAVMVSALIYQYFERPITRVLHLLFTRRSISQRDVGTAASGYNGPSEISRT